MSDKTPARRTFVGVGSAVLLVLLASSGGARAEFENLWSELYSNESAKLTPPARMLFQGYASDCMTLPNKVSRARHDLEDLQDKGYTRNQALQTMMTYKDDYTASRIALDIPRTVSDRDVWKRTMEVCMHEAARRAAE